MEEQEVSELLHNLVLQESPAVGTVTDCLRSLRNSCAQSTETQTKLGDSDSVLNDANTAINMGLNSVDNEDWKLCLRISAQFLGNLIVNNPRNQQKVWSHCCSQLKSMAKFGDSKLTNICLMVLYNILLGNPIFIKDLEKDEEFLKIILESGAEGIEFAQYIVEQLLSQDFNLSKIYNMDLPINERLFVLEVVEDRITKKPGDIPLSFTSLLATQFRQLSDCILRTVADKVDALEPIEVATLLRIIASVSPLPPHLASLQQDKSFFINCAFLLKSIHMAGKEGNPCFSAVQKLSASESDSQLQAHPAFGFKASLIQVLGNLCWKHKPNQNLMRELEIIPLLLDCCNIDARNPFIIQWVVLAVRNLCEDNMDNQAVIASMSRQGLVESRVLTEMGLTIHADGDNNQIHIAPLQPNS